MRQPRKSPEPSTLQRMGGLEERTSEIGRARAEAERRESSGADGFDDLFSDSGRPGDGKRRRGHVGPHVQAVRRPRR